jgi:hypothetical protein
MKAFNALNLSDLDHLSVETTRGSAAGWIRLDEIYFDFLRKPQSGHEQAGE